jgi:hypothetical protein
MHLQEHNWCRLISNEKKPKLRIGIFKLTWTSVDIHRLSQEMHSDFHI